GRIPSNLWNKKRCRKKRGTPACCLCGRGGSAMRQPPSSSGGTLNLRPAGLRFRVELFRPLALELVIREKQLVLHRSRQRVSRLEHGKHLSDPMHAEAVNEVTHGGIGFKVGHCRSLR